MSNLIKPREGLALISTRWPLISDPVQFVFRYAPAIRGYLQALLRQPADVDEVLQDFLVAVLEGRFAAERIRHGRFRDYLIAAVRYSAIGYLRRKSPEQLTPEQTDQLQSSDPSVADLASWLTGWRQCLLERAWETTERHERKSTGNWFYTVLKLASDNADADSKALAERVPSPLSPEAFRKQLSRARTFFAEALYDEVKKTLETPTDDQIMDELAEMGLLEYVKPYLPRPV